MADRVLKDIFTVPPISVLDVKQKYWKDRRKHWLSLNIKSELGREGNLLSLSPLLQTKTNGTSIFDPVVCEALYAWMSKEGDTILDPFAGGSVRGVVASKMNRRYIGYDVRADQIEHNRIQANEMGLTLMPTWINAPSQHLDTNNRVDLIFTCPPYYDLEQYSDDPNDLSNMDANGFEESIAKIFQRCIEALNEDRFAVVVVGDVRDSRGMYRRLPNKITDIFEANGCPLYNDMILLQEPATAAMRAFKFMNAGRKIAKCHQNVLVFVKGDPKAATNRMPKFISE